MDNFDEFLAEMKENIGRQIIKKRRIYFEVQDEKLKTIVGYLINKLGCRLSTATATEVYKGIEVMYHFSHDKTGTYFCPRILITDKKKPQMNSITIFYGLGLPDILSNILIIIRLICIFYYPSIEKKNIKQQSIEFMS